MLLEIWYPYLLYAELYDSGFISQERRSEQLHYRDLMMRAHYMAEICVYDPSLLVFIDELGSDRRNASRMYGYSLRGETPRMFRFLSRGKRISAITACPMMAF